MRIIIAGDWEWPQYEAAFATALADLGHVVVPFRTSGFFRGPLGHAQRAVPVPTPAMWRMNRALMRLVSRHRPDLLLAWRCTHLLPSTVQRVRAMSVVTVSYNNDDPFGPSVHDRAPWHHRLLWVWYLRCLPHHERNFFYRRVNVADAWRRGVDHADLLMPYFVPWRDRPLVLNDADAARYGCDLVFAGHYEADDRVAHLRALVDAGLSVRLFGGSGWSRAVLGNLYAYFGPIAPVEGDEYAKALAGARVCLAFLSKLNRDAYTRRCFEIPACGRVMLAERTEELTQMFEDDVEACFFSSPKELVEKARWLVGNPRTASRIAEAGRRRVWADGHDIHSRVTGFLRMLADPHVAHGAAAIRATPNRFSRWDATREPSLEAEQ